MKTVSFSNVYEFVEHFVNSYYIAKDATSEDDFFGISVVAPFTPMIEIINTIVKESSFSLYSIEIEESDVCGYDGDFILNVDPDGNIWVQRTTYENGKVVFCEDNIIFVSEEANSKFITKNKNENIICFTFSDDECEDNECDITELAATPLSGIISCSEDNMHGFTASKTDGNAQMWCSFYSSEKLDKDDYKELLREFGFSN